MTSASSQLRLITVIIYLSLFSLALAFSAPALAQERIRIGISSVSPGFIPTVVAEKKGFYLKHGLRSEPYSYHSLSRSTPSAREI